MELRDLLIADVESLSPTHAGFVARDLIDVLSKGAPAEYQSQLRTLLVATQEVATGRKVGDEQDTIRAEVLEKIQDAEARGDKRTARYLAESMGKHDMAAVEVEEHRIANPAQKFIDDESAASNPA